MPYAPRHAKKQYTAAQTEAFLHNRLQIIPPAVFLTEKWCKGHKKIKRRDEQIDPRCRILHNRKYNI